MCFLSTKEVCMKKFINQFTSFLILLFSISTLIMTGLGCSEKKSDRIIGSEQAKLTKAPFVPEPITRDYPTKVIIDLEVLELEKELTAGVKYTVWTFGGDVPGSFMRVREGDFVEFRLHNHSSSKLPHNIDLHAVTGPGGGAEASFTAPGHTSVFSFTALNAGLYVYHCATAPVGLHIANGMYGLIYVQPKEALPTVDKEYYIMQSEFYTVGNYGEPGLQSFSMEKALTETPDYVVFNGSVGSLVGDKAIQAKTGERIRLFVGNGGPNLISSFHVIGEIFDLVYSEGGTNALQKNVQTTVVPAGGSSIVEFKVDVPGKFILVDHSIFRAFNKGALGMLEVEGEKNLKTYSGKIKESIYLGTAFSNDLNKNKTAAESSDSKPDFMRLGQSIYNESCAACHQVDGKGLPNVFPPLLNSDYLKNKEAAISTIISGKTGPITVNGKTYNGVMPPQNLNNQQAAAVLTYVYNKFNNSKMKVTEKDVEKVRNSKGSGK